MNVIVMRLTRVRKQETGISNKQGVAGGNQEVKQEAYKTYFSKNLSVKRFMTKVLNE